MIAVMRNGAEYCQRTGTVFPAKLQLRSVPVEKILIRQTHIEMVSQINQQVVKLYSHSLRRSSSAAEEYAHCLNLYTYSSIAGCCCTRISDAAPPSNTYW